MLKTQQRFRSEKHNVFTEETNKIALSSNDGKRTHLIRQEHIHMERVKV